MLQITFRKADASLTSFSEQEGHLLGNFVFFFFGLVIARWWRNMTPAVIVYAILSLTLVRMLPVAISMIGTRLSVVTASTFVLQIIGPLGAKFAISRAGEIGRASAEDDAWG